MSLSPIVVTGRPATNTEKFVEVVSAEQCIGGQPLAPQHGCGVTFDPSTVIGRPLTSTVGLPVTTTPPTAFRSPNLLTGPGTILSH